MTEALNMRLGTKNLKMADIAVEISKRNMTLADLLAQREVDGWKYSDGYSYVCSSFVAAVYKAGGLLKDIEGTEMTPKDVSQFLCRFILSVFMTKTIMSLRSARRTTPPYLTARSWAGI